MKSRFRFNKKSLLPFGQVLGSQIILKILGVGIGILLVREMPKVDYAIYTILMAVQGIFVILSSSGIMIGFRKIGGKIWSDNNKMASLIKTGSFLRSYMTLAAFLIAGSYGGVLLFEQDIPILQIIFFLIALFLIVFPGIWSVFIVEAFLIKKDVASVQLKSIIKELIRFVLLILLYVFFRDYLVINSILVVTIISVWVGYLFILHRSKHFRNKNAIVVPEYKKTLLYYIKRLWHNEMFFAFNNQISIFILGIYGTTGNIAELGALGRFTFIFATLVVLVTNIFAPKFARTFKAEYLKKQYLQLVGFLIICFLAIYSIVSLFPDAFLWLLGPEYAELQLELNFFIILGGVNLLVSATSYLNQAKGWVRFRPVFEIPVNVIGFILGVSLFDISNLLGVIYLSILIAILNLLLTLANSVAGFKSIQHNPQ